MYFETGQGSALSAGAHHGVDQQTLEARAYGVARRFSPLLVNTVVGFIGPEYLLDGKQIVRAGLEDHFCGKVLGLPMGVDVCYTNHAEADKDDMDTLLTLLGVAGCTYIMGVPGADDIMLGYQSTSFHDSHYLRQVLGLRPAPEFEEWLRRMAIATADGRLAPIGPRTHALLKQWGLLNPSEAPSRPARGKPRRRARSLELSRFAHGGADRPGKVRGKPEDRISFGFQPGACAGKGRRPFSSASTWLPLEGRPPKLAGIATERLATAARDRASYLARPDLGRALAPDSADQAPRARRLARPARPRCHSLGWACPRRRRRATPPDGRRGAHDPSWPAGWSVYPVFVVPFARVKVQDEIGGDPGGAPQRRSSSASGPALALTTAWEPT